MMENKPLGIKPEDLESRSQAPDSMGVEVEVDAEVDGAEPKYDLGQQVMYKGEIFGVVKRHPTDDGWQYDLLPQGKDVFSVRPLSLDDMATLVSEAELSAVEFKPLGAA